MKIHLLLLLVLFSSCSFGQITNGEYYSYGITSQGEKIVFLPNNHLELINGEDTIGGYGNSMNGEIVACKYTIDYQKTPNYFDLVLYDVNSGAEVQVIQGLINQIDKNLIEISNIFQDVDRPIDLTNNYTNVLKLTLNNQENYANNLKINEKYGLIGFNPEVKEVIIDKTKKEIYYQKNGKPLNLPDFQSKEILEYNDQGLLIKRTLLDSKNNLFVNELGYSIEVYQYCPDGKIEQYEAYVNEKELMIYSGTGFPKVKNSYKDGVLIQVDRLVNNEKYKKTIPSTLKFIYDSYGDQLGVDYYYEDGVMKVDSAKQIVISSISNWINRNAIYPKTFMPLLYGKPNLSYDEDGDQIVPKSNKIEIYIEFLLNDKSNIQTKFKGYLVLDYAFNVISIANKKASNKTEWNYKEYEEWMSKYFRELTAEEKKKIEVENEKIVQEMYKVFVKAVEFELNKKKLD